MIILCKYFKEMIRSNRTDFKECRFHEIQSGSLVIEIDESVHATDEIIYRWYGHGSSNHTHSLLDYVEDNSDRLRHKYLRWISELGETTHRERRLTEWLALNNTLSYWWMTLLTETSIFKSPEIIDAIRLLALEELVDNHSPTQLVLVSDDLLLRRSVEQLCQNRNIPFSCRNTNSRHTQRHLSRMAVRKGPSVILALAMFGRYLRRYWFIRSLKTRTFHEASDAVLFATRSHYLENPNSGTPMPHAANWPNLQRLLDDSKISSNWLEMLFMGKDAADGSKLRQQIDRYRKHYSENETHILLDSLLSIRIIVQVIILYLKLVKIFLQLGNQRIERNIKNRPWLWQLTAYSWNRSMIGHVAVENLFWFVLFDKALGDVSPQMKGFFTFEGQSWEVAFVSAWKRHKLGELVAVTHSTIPFWDLRRFSGISHSSQSDQYSRPNPDLIAVNGPLARLTLVGVGYPPEKIVECEALRYQDLRVANRWEPRSREAYQPLRIILVADYMQAFTETMTEMLKEALPDLPSETQVSIKLHPNGVISAKTFGDMMISVRQDPISQLVQDFDVALVSSRSSAIVDLCVLGIPLVVVEFEDSLDLSPLKSILELPTVSNADELVETLKNARVPVEPLLEPDDAFFLDPSLNLWSSLLSNSPAGHP